MFAELHNFLNLSVEGSTSLDETLWLVKDTPLTRGDFVLHSLLALHLQRRSSTVILVSFQNTLEHYKSCARKYVSSVLRVLRRYFPNFSVHRVSFSKNLLRRDPFTLFRLTDSTFGVIHW